MLFIFLKLDYVCFKSKHSITISPSQYFLLKMKNYFAKLWCLCNVVLEVCYEQFWTLEVTSIVPGKTRLQNTPFQAGKAKWALDEVQVYLWYLVLLEGFPGLWRSTAGMFSACFSVWGLCCGSPWLWGTKYGYQVFFFSPGSICDK